MLPLKESGQFRLKKPRMTNSFFLLSLGCPKNRVDSNKLIEKFEVKGLLYSDKIEESDIVLINTCGFIETAKQESIEEILKCSRLMNPKSKLIVFGCLAKRYKTELSKDIPEIDAIFGVGEEDKIIKYCSGISKDRTIRHTASFTADKSRIRHRNFSSYAYIKIAEGCDKHCTYCVIPSLRGKYKSFKPNEIAKEAEKFISKGIKELILIAQDTSCYGKDLKMKFDLAKLLKKLCAIEGDFWIRLLYLYPDSINDTLIRTIAEENKICKYLDIPLQHSEQRILKLMGRKGNREEYLGLIEKLRSAIPDITLRTTLIAGFPSETEKEFESLVDCVNQARFDRLGVFKYSREEGTPAAKLKGQISEKIKNHRLETIMKCQSYISLERNKRLVGKKFRAIIDSIEGSTAIARLYSHAPEIDGVVMIEHPLNPRTLEPCLVKTGDFVNVKITEALDYDLKGMVIS